MLLVFGAIIGVPVAAVAYFFLEAVAEAQEYVFTTLPGDLGFDSQPSWWPIPFLALSGLLVALTIRYLPGTAGHKPAEGFKASGAVQPIELPGHRHRVVRDAQPRRRARPGGAADRDRQRPGRSRGAPDQARRAGDGERRDRRRGQLRRDRDPARLAARRRVPAHGGRRARRRDDGRRARARACSPPGSARSSTSGSTTGRDSGRSRSRSRTSRRPAARPAPSSSGRSRSASSPRSLGACIRRLALCCSSRSSSGAWCS